MRPIELFGWSTPLFQKKQLFNPAVLTAVIAGSMAVSVANAGLVTVDNCGIFTSWVVFQGGSMEVEDFSGYSGHYASALVGGSGAGEWIASAPGGLFAGSAGISTATVEGALTFAFSDPGVFAVGGNFFLTDTNQSVISGVIEIIADNVVYSYVTDGSDTSFLGFISTDGAIQSISIRPLTSGACATSSSLRIGFVPAPAVLAAVAMAGLLRRRHR